MRRRRLLPSMICVRVAGLFCCLTVVGWVLGWFDDGTGGLVAAILISATALASIAGAHVYSNAGR